MSDGKVIVRLMNWKGCGGKPLLKKVYTGENQEILAPGCDSIVGPSEYEIEVLTTEPRFSLCSVVNSMNLMLCNRFEIVRFSQYL